MSPNTLRMTVITMLSRSWSRCACATAWRLRSAAAACASRSAIDGMSSFGDAAEAKEGATADASSPAWLLPSSPPPGPPPGPLLGPSRLSAAGTPGTPIAAPCEETSSRRASISSGVGMLYGKR